MGAFLMDPSVLSSEDGNLGRTQNLHTLTAGNIAEQLRMAGNASFQTKDYRRAVALYKESLGVDVPGALAQPAAKCHSNLAAALSKLGEYKDAEYHAERASIL